MVSGPASQSGSFRVNFQTPGRTTLILDVTDSRGGHAQKTVDLDVVGSVQEAANFAGTWVDAGTTLATTSRKVTLGGTGDALSGTMEWTQPGASHSVQGSDGKISGCRVNGLSAICKGGGEYHDPDKSIPYTSTLTLTLAGNSLTIQEHIDSDSPSWKVPKYDYYAVQTGHTLGCNLTRAR